MSEQERLALPPNSQNGHARHDRRPRRLRQSPGADYDNGDGQKVETGSLVVLLLAERARSEGTRSTRALEDQPGYPVNRETSEVEEGFRNVLVDARSEGQSGDSPRRDRVTLQGRSQVALVGLAQ